MRGSDDREQGIKALHLVTAWVAEQNLTLGQIKVEDHSHEITAIPALLELIDIQGAVITIDAMGTQTEIVRLIRAKKADYVLALKTNHPTLHAQVKNWFDKAIALSKNHTLFYQRLENQVHWTLDVTLRCDPAEVSSESRTRTKR